MNSGSSTRNTKPAACMADANRCGSHSQTIGGFNREFVKTGVFPPDTSRKLQRSFQDRQTADYDWYHHIEEADAGVAVSDAESIVSQCRQQVANWQREHRREDSRT